MELASDSLATMNRITQKVRNKGLLVIENAALHRSRRLAVIRPLPSETCKNSKVLQEHDHKTKVRKAVRKEERRWCRCHREAGGRRQD